MINNMYLMIRAKVVYQRCYHGVSHTFRQVCRFIQDRFISNTSSIAPKAKSKMELMSHYSLVESYKYTVANSAI